MLALAYLAIAIALGDRVCAKFWRMRSPLHRWASAFLIGTLVSAWITYLLAVAFAFTARPLIWANLFSFAIAISFIVLLRRRSKLDSTPSSLTKLNWPDALFLFAFVVIACWLMFGTLGMRDGDVRLASVVWNDFGPNLALMQSFALGHNFPAEYPYFIGEPIRYHFLFWFQGGNLEFLGLTPSWALNLLSTLSMLALLVSIMTLGEALFGSRVIGGIAAILLFFHGSLSYVPFLFSQHSIGTAIKAIVHMNHWLASGFSYKGEDWGIWSPSILYVQRHLLAAIGIFCLVLTFLVNFYKERLSETDRVPAAADCSIDSSVRVNSTTVQQTVQFPSVGSFVFSGALLGLLVLWNSPIFVSALAVIGCLFLFLPGRGRVATLLAAALLIGVPQILSLGVAQTTQRFSILHWGYTIDNPTIPRVLAYFLFTFGPKLALGVVTMFLLTKSQRLLFLAMSSLIVLAFGTQLSVEIMNNQKFLYVWVILLNLFVAYGLARIYRIRFLGKIAAIVLAAIVIMGGVIELFRVHNDNWVDIPFRQNALSNWLLQNTLPTDVFLTDRYIHHPILMNGRRIFYGWPYFPWSMGYRTAERDTLYKRLFTEQNPGTLINLLKRNGINYVVIDDGLRQGELAVATQEKLFMTRFSKVYDDPEKRFGGLTIYKVPD